MITGSDLLDPYLDNHMLDDGYTDPPEVDEDEQYEAMRQEEIDDEARRKEARRANGDRLTAALRGIALSSMEVTAKHGLPSGLGRRKNRRDK